MASVSLERVSKSYGDVPAVRDLDLEIADGEVLMLVGPSGCGKTTVLRLIAGLEVPDTGTIRFDGGDMAGVPPADRNIAMVFEDYALYPHMAVRDNLAFSLRLHQVPREEVDRRVSAVASTMELDDLLARRPPNLATGEAQHVAVGRAVIRETPDVLLLDDALAHLDAQQRVEARAEVSRLHQDLACTIVAVTHDQAEALALGTHLVVMDDGTLQQEGSSQELYEHPANTFVAGFIGSPPMNLLEASLEQHDGRSWLRSGEIELEMPRRFEGNGSSRLTVGLRPEDLALATASSPAGLHLRGRCELVEYLGSQLLVHVRIGDHEVVVLDDPADEIAPGGVVDCFAAPERLHLFDTGTGRALAQSPA